MPRLFTGSSRPVPSLRNYWLALGIIGGWRGHVSKGPKWTFFHGWHEIATALEQVERGDYEEVV